jgi:hypothetical protein
VLIVGRRISKDDSARRYQTLLGIKTMASDVRVDLALACWKLLHSVPLETPRSCLVLKREYGYRYSTMVVVASESPVLLVGSWRHPLRPKAPYPEIGAALDKQNVRLLLPTSYHDGM